MRRERRGLVAGGVALAFVAVAAWAIVQAGTPAAGPVPVAWDRQACAHCAMHVGEPSFAVQLHTTDGDVLFFDDPGCYFAYVAERQPAIHATWFHDHDADRWLPDAAVAFRPVATSPMGWGIGAVPAGTAGAVSAAAASDLVLAGKRGDGTRRERPSGESR